VLPPAPSDWNRTAESQAVPPPFLPIRLENGSYSILGRLIDVDATTGFPGRIEAFGRAISQGPSGWRRGDASGNAIAATSSIEPGAWGARSASWTATSAYPDLRIRTKATLEFDGFIRFRAVVSPLADVATVHSLAFSQQLSSSVAKRYTRLGTGTSGRGKSSPDWTPSAVFSSGPVEPGCRQLPFSFQYTINDAEVGLLVAVESIRTWLPGPESAAVRICRTETEVRLELPVIAGPTRLSEPTVFEFAIQVLPVKPLPDRKRVSDFNVAQFPDADLLFRRRLHQPGSLAGSLASPAESMNESALKAAADAGLKTLVVHQGWNEIQGYPGTRDPERLEMLGRVVEEARRRGLKVLIYVGRELSQAAPEWPRAHTMVAVPLRAGRSRGPVRAYRPGGGESAWAELLVSRISALRDATGVDGLFLDLVADTDASANDEAGLGFVDAGGTVHADRKLFANRSLMMRLYEIFHPPGSVGDSLEGAGVIACHTEGPIEPGHGFCDVLMAGETEIAEARRDRQAALQRLRQLEAFRSTYAPGLRGAPVIWLSKPVRGGLSIDANGALTLLHGIPQRVQWPHFILRTQELSMLNPATDLPRHWAAWRSGIVADGDSANWYPYWRNADYVSELPPRVYASFRLLEAGRVVAVVSNLGEGDQRISLRLDLSDLGTNGTPITVSDPLNEGDVELSSNDIRLDVAALSFRLLELQYQ